MSRSPWGCLLLWSRISVGGLVWKTGTIYWVSLIKDLPGYFFPRDMHRCSPKSLQNIISKDKNNKEKWKDKTRWNRVSRGHNSVNIEFYVRIHRGIKIRKWHRDKHNNECLFSMPSETIPAKVYHLYRQKMLERKQILFSWHCSYCITARQIIL